MPYKRRARAKNNKNEGTKRCFPQRQKRPYRQMIKEHYTDPDTGLLFEAYPIPPLFCVCWMRKRGYLRSVPARATNRRDSSSPSREANRKVLLRSPTRICLTRFALSPARTGFPASVTGCAGSGLPMQKPCALTSMRAFRRTFVLLRRAMMQNNP